MGFITNTRGRICKECRLRLNNDKKACIECFSQFLIPIKENNRCKLCLYPMTLMNSLLYTNCCQCHEKIKENKSYIDGFITCSYEAKKSFGFALHAYKGSSIELMDWMSFPLQALAYMFLLKHYACVVNLFGVIDALVPIPGHAEKLLLPEIQQLIPIKSILIDRKRGRLSNGTAKRIFDPNRFIVNKDNVNIVPENILLFDDVFTSGSTVDSAAFTLKNNGAKKVVVLSLARHIYEEDLDRTDKKEFSIERCSLCIYRIPY